MPTNKNLKILAIDPGTREMGVAVLEDSNLLDYSVKTFRHRGNPRLLLAQVEKLITRLISESRPDVLALEKNMFSQIQQNYLLTLAIAKIKAVAKRMKVEVKEYAPNTVRKAVCNNGTAKKRELARAVALRYPELKVYLDSDMKWKQRYWQNLFDAVGVGLTTRFVQFHRL
jgi:Holliday junction resolvasome RuvABC endonuclease subunit